MDANNAVIEEGKPWPITFKRLVHTEVDKLAKDRDEQKKKAEELTGRVQQLELEVGEATRVKEDAQRISQITGET